MNHQILTDCVLSPRLSCRTHTPRHLSQIARPRIHIVPAPLPAAAVHAGASREMAAPAAATRFAHCTLLLVLLVGAFADEMVVEDESADDSAGGSDDDSAGGGDSGGDPPAPDFDYEEMMRSMGGGMGGMDNPYMQKLKRENPGA
jgi:hypothetical protein